jgi:hypothetical protein
VAVTVTRLRVVIKEQDQLIAEKSGNPVLVVKSIRRSGTR